MKPQDLIAEQRRKQRRRYYRIAGLLVLLAGLSVLYLCIGKTSYSLPEVLSAISGKGGSAAFTVGVLRLPRLWMGLLAGLALGAAGTTFQTLLRNPLASPDIIGVSTGTSAAALFCILFLQLSGSITSLISITCGLGIAALLVLCGKRTLFSSSRMILVGLGLQAMLNALISYMLLKANQQDVSTAMRWLSGSLTGMRMEQVLPMALVILPAIAVLTLLQRHLAIMETGEELAITLGVSTAKVRAFCILFAVILLAFTTSACGPIAFVSFLAGPISRQLNKEGSINILMAALIGAALVVTGDFIAQTLFATRFPVGVMTGILGAPYLLILLIRMNKTGGIQP